MKKILPFLILFAMACKKDDPDTPSTPTPVPTPGQNYFVLDADTFWCNQFNVYRSGGTSTVMIQGDSTTNAGAVLFIPFAAIDSTQISGGTQHTIQETSAGPHYNNNYTNIIITSYGNVGQLIEGYYHGVWHDTQNTSIQKQVKGVFSITRTPDQ